MTTSHPKEKVLDSSPMTEQKGTGLKLEDPIAVLVLSFINLGAWTRTFCEEEQGGGEGGGGGGEKEEEEKLSTETMTLYCL